ncbi:cell division protein FtsW [bacterium]|nr:cell division protein FtsW [bacterium]
MIERKKYDVYLLWATLLLAVLGMVMVSSATQVIAKERYATPYFFMQREAMHLGIGILFLLVCMRIPFEIYRRISVIMLVISILLLIAVLLWGKEIRGARRWLTIYHVTIQPVELVKYSLVIFIADLIARGRGGTRRFKEGFLPIFIFSIVIAFLLVLQPNISNAILIIALSMTLLFLGKCKFSHLAGYYGAVVIASAPYLYLRPHVYNRFLGIFNRGEFVLAQNWHVRQSLISLGSGFLFGCGLGNGHQKFNFLPDAHTDFIYSIIGEEIGIAGTLFVLTIFVFMFFRVLKITRNAPNTFGRFLALGIGLVIFSTALINICMSIGLLPTIGLQLPFVSYGGTSLVTSMAATGVLLNISRNGKRNTAKGHFYSAGRRIRPVFARRIRENGGGLVK